ncbi:LLM class F420-dependent oxidoreductase [Mycobacterium sp. 1245805.9]|nr:TIGR03564 family F420-dependent LLM class oxidoreductase [Mycobacterium sp. 1245805.9]OBI90715.1 LLM class F420-dependent oxidoreductase [Mycobacterium sp. 1245805.9]
MQISVNCFLSDNPSRSVVDDYVSELAMLRDEGFRRSWVAQMPWQADVLTVLAVAFREVDTIEIATGVLPIQNQQPMLMAQRALTLSLISGGRFILGLGMTHRIVTEGMWGIPWDKPVRRLGEYLDGLLPLLDGKDANATGETVTTRGSVRVPGAPTPPVYIAALGPQLLRLTGRRCAGTETWMTGPKTLAEHVGPTLRNAAAEAGRPEGEVRVAASLPIAVTDDVDGLRAQAAEQFAVYGQMPSYRAMLDREGYRDPQDAALIGDEATVTERLEELRAAGVDELVAYAFDESDEGRARTRSLLRTYAG